MDISDWRKKIDEIDQKLVAILNERAQAAQEIGRLKRQSDLPIYEPDYSAHKATSDHTRHRFGLGDPRSFAAKWAFRGRLANA